MSDENKVTEPTPTEPTNLGSTGNEDTIPTGTENNTGAGKTFTQEEFDRIIAERIARERKKFADYEDIKTKVVDYEKQLEEKRLADLSDIERANEAAKKFESEKQSLEQKLADIQNQIKQEKLMNAFIKAATGANITYIDDAMKLADLSAVEFDEQGNVKGVEDVVKTLVLNKPFLVGQAKPQEIGGPSNPTPQGQTKATEQILRDAAEKARQSGRTEDFAEYARLKQELSQ